MSNIKLNNKDALILLDSEETLQYLKKSTSIKARKFNKDPEDTFQEVYIKLRKYFQRGHSLESSMKALINSTTNSHIFNNHRKKLSKSQKFSAEVISKQVIGLSCSEPDPCERLINEETVRIQARKYVHKSTLRDDDKKIILGIYQDGKSVKDLAKEFNLKESAIKMRLKRGKAKIKRAIEQDYPDLYP